MSKTIYQSLLFSFFLFSRIWSFDSYEHEYIGDNVKLHGIESNLFTLDNGLNITFGQIVSMPDYYGVSHESIALDLKTQKVITDPNEQEKRFLAVFNAFSKAKIEEGREILKVIDKEKKTIQQALQEGIDEYQAYQKIGSEENVEFTLITDGYYVELSSINFDHFVDPSLNVAQSAFLSGYRIALNMAQKADSKDLEALKKAYVIYAFACHYLTDTFSAGHMRVPRFALWQKVKGPLGPEISGVLALCQHNEDGFYGLNVTNGRTTWKAYGDACLLEHQTNEKMPIEAMQKGLDNIYMAFLKKNESIESIEWVLPKLSEENFCPLFKLDSSGKLLRRKDITNRYQNEYISEWCPLSTMIKLYWYHINDPERVFTRDKPQKVKQFLYHHWAKPMVDKNQLTTLKDNYSPNIYDVKDLPEIPDEKLHKLFEEDSLSSEHAKVYSAIIRHLHNENTKKQTN
jgi:hypothetical protein